MNAMEFTQFCSACGKGSFGLIGGRCADCYADPSRKPVTKGQLSKALAESERLLSLARAVIEALPKCWLCDETATFKQHREFACEEHQTENRPAPWRSALSAWKEAQR